MPTIGNKECFNMKKLSIAEMKRLNKENGYCYFSKETMKFWGAKVISTYNNGLFIEALTASVVEDDTVYKVSIMMPNGDICTIDKDNEYSFFSTLEDAKSRVKNLNKTFKNLGARELETLNNLDYVYSVDENNCLTFESSKNEDNPSYQFQLNLDAFEENGTYKIVG